MSLFQTNSQFFFKVWITLQCADRSFFCTFLAETLYPTDKSSTSKCKFPDLPLLALKFNKLFMLFLEPRVTFPSNLASLFSVTRNNSSVLFHLNLYMLLKKRANLTSTARMKITKFLTSFSKSWVSFPLNFASPFSVMTHNSSEIFYLKHYMLWTKRVH